MNKKIILIDGNALMYKAFYASAFLMKKGQGFDSEGRPINALATFSTMILNLRERFDESNMLVAFDEKGLQTYRTKHEFYKAGRTRMPDELITQKPLILKFLELSGISQKSHPNLEADDIIGILSKKYSREGIEVDIVTSDKDLLQLVDNNVNVYISKTGVSDMEEYTINNFSEKFFGLNPSQVIDLKGVMGDASDNLAGIKGIGEKGAVKLLNEFGTLENIIEHKDSFSPSIKTKIEEGFEMGILCKEIATIITDYDLEIDFNSTLVKPPRWQELIAFFRYYSINGIANRLEKKWL